MSALAVLPTFHTAESDITDIIQVDYKVMAAKLNYGSENAATTAWNRIRRKLVTPAGTNGTSLNQDGPNLPTTPTKKRARKANLDQDGSAVKKARKGGKSKNENTGGATEKEKSVGAETEGVGYDANVKQEQDTEEDMGADFDLEGASSTQLGVGGETGTSYGVF